MNSTTTSTTASPGALDFDLDIEVEAGATSAGPAITSYFLCTPGCAHTGSWNSFCC